MKKRFTFDWMIFKSKGFEFQEMCADIFRFYKYDVRVFTPGGSDEGRDIELYTYSTKNLVTGSRMEILMNVTTPFRRKLTTHSGRN